MDQNKRFYDLKAEQYADEWYANQTMLPSIKEFISLFPIKTPTILDLGCGPGHESKRLKETGAQVIGIDYSSESIKIAKNKNPVINFLEMDYLSIDTSLGVFDGIFSCSSLIHLQEKELVIVLDKVNKVLKTNGLFLVIYRIGSGQIIQNHEINGEKVIRTIEQYEKESLISIFRNQGFDFIQDGFLDNSLKPNWDSAIFQKMY